MCGNHFKFGRYELQQWHITAQVYEPKQKLKRYKPITKICYGILKIFYSRIFYWLTDWLTHSLPPLLMPSDRCNSIMAIALISSLFNIASSGDMPFRQPQQLQCLHHGSTETYFCSPLCSILSLLLHRWQFVVHMLWFRCES